MSCQEGKHGFPVFHAMYKFLEPGFRLRRPRRFALGTRPARCRRRILEIRERRFAFPSGWGRLYCGQAGEYLSGTPLRSAQSRGPPDLVRPCPKTRLRHVLSINKTPLWSIGKRERRSSRFLTPFFLWTRGESNPCPKTHSLFFYYHS